MDNPRWRFAVAMVLGLGAWALAAAPAHGATRIEKQLALAPGGRLIVKSDVGSIVVHGDAPSGAAVVVTADRDDFDQVYEMSFNATPGRAEVLIRRRHPLGGWFGGGSGWRGRVEIAVSVPHATSASIQASGGRVEASGLTGDTDLTSSGGPVIAHDLAGKLEAESSGGRVEVRDVRGDVHLSSSGGGVRAAAVQGAVEAKSSGGSIQIDRVTGSVHADSSGGGVTVRDAGSSVDASSSGGPVNVRFAAGNAHGGDIDSSGGGVEVYLDPAVSLDLDASTSAGSVSCDLPVTVEGKVSRTSLRGVLRGGGQRLRVRSSGGGVRIAAL